jgi:hypothetical protein
MRSILIAALCLLPTQGFAQSITLTIDNRSSQPVVRLNTFGVDKAGIPVEDNLGAIMDDVPAGTTGTLALSLLRCGRVYVALGLGVGSAEVELTTTIDTCKSRTLVVSD